MPLVLRLLIGGGLGLALGGLIGYLGKGAGGTCPLTCHPYRGMLVGALFGLAIAYTMRPGGAEIDDSLSAVDRIDSREAFSRRVTSASGSVVVDFYLPRCGPCRRLAPTIARLADEYRGQVDFVRVDGEKTPDVAEQFGVRTVPTVVVFHHGEVVQTLVGAKKPDAYRTILNRMLKKNKETTE